MHQVGLHTQTGELFVSLFIDVELLLMTYISRHADLNISEFITSCYQTEQKSTGDTFENNPNKL